MAKLAPSMRQALGSISSTAKNKKLEFVIDSVNFVFGAKGGNQVLA